MMWSTIRTVFMDWFSSFDLSQLSDWTIAQTPAPSPTPRSNDLELLRSQIEFLKTSNAQLSDSFAKFLEAMKFALTFLSVLGGVAVAIVGFLVGQNVLEARKNIREARENFREETRITGMEGWGTLKAPVVHAWGCKRGSRADVSRQSSENGLTHEAHHLGSVLSSCST
ncbi:unknown protein [Leptolyngbya sp. NIES-3755]|nr:unknown protein [Leptolyngbya sp. NIES-3755]